MWNHFPLSFFFHYNLKLENKYKWNDQIISAKKKITRSSVAILFFIVGVLDMLLAFGFTHELLQFSSLNSLHSPQILRSLW